MKRPSLSLVRRLLITLVAFAIIAPAMFTDAPLVAQEEATAEESAQDEDAEEKAATNEDLFKVPEGDAKTLQAYIKKLANTPPEGETEEEQIEFSKKALNALVIAADRLLAAKPNKTQAKQGHGFRIQALQALAGPMGQEDAREKLEKAMKAARTDKNEEIVGIGWQSFIGDRTDPRTGRWGELGPKEQQAFRDEIIATVKADGPQEMDVSIVQVTALNLDGTDDKFLVSLLEETAPLFAKSEDKDVKAALKGANFEGMLRRLKLPGNPLEIKGELLSGGEVDWDSYRGKVVLVDFWATWCGPCRAEVPNIIAMYKAYHDKGFDVLGVSLDSTPEAAKKYAKTMKLPWDSLFQKNEEEREWNHPLVHYYGIGGIPTAILVDKDGKVVNMNARGEILQEELQRLLGDPIVSPEVEKDAAQAEEKAAAEAS